MDDRQIHGTIEQLVAEEHELWQRESAGIASETDMQRLQQLKVSLDQCWNLLRQRRVWAPTRPGSGHRYSSRPKRGRATSSALVVRVADKTSEDAPAATRRFMGGSCGASRPEAPSLLYRPAGGWRSRQPSGFGGDSDRRSR